MSRYSGRNEPTPNLERWRYRTLITVANSAPATNLKPIFTIPKDLEHFWTNCLSTGADVRIVDGDGMTLCTFELVGWVLATRTASIEVDTVAFHAVKGMYTLWLYYGNSTAVSVSTAVAAGAIPAAIECGAPSGRIVRLGPEAPGATRPANVLAKASVEQAFFWIDVTDYLTMRRLPFEGSLAFEELFGALVRVELAGADQAAIYDISLQRLVYYRDRTYIKAFFQAGTSGTDYTVIVGFYTKVSAGDSINQYIQGRFLLRVRDVSEV